MACDRSHSGQCTRMRSVYWFAGVQRECGSRCRPLHDRLQSDCSSAGLRRGLKTRGTTCHRLGRHKEARNDSRAARRQGHADSLKQQSSAHLNRIKPCDQRLAVNAVAAVHRQSVWSQSKIT